MFNFFSKFFKKKKSLIDKFNDGQLSIEEWNSQFKTPADHLNLIIENTQFLNDCFKKHAHMCIHRMKKISYEFIIDIQLVKQVFGISYPDIRNFFKKMPLNKKCGKSFIFKGLYLSQSISGSDYLKFEKYKEGDK